VTFSPTARGSIEGTLVLSTNDPTTPRFTVLLAGQGVTPFEVSPSMLDFGEQHVNTLSPSRQVTIRNTGDGPLVITGVTTTGRFATSSPSGTITLEPGTHLALPVTFSPDSVGSFSGVLTLTTNDPTFPSLSIPLTGQGVKPMLRVSPTSLDFGEQRVGTTSPVRRVTVSNIGTGSLVITHLSLTSGPFAFSPTVGSITLTPNTSQELSVTFSPTTAGAFSSTLSLTSNDPDRPSVSIALAGTAVNPDLELTPSRLDFGASNVGTSAALQEVRFHNPSDLALRISSVSFSGTAAADFSAVPPGSFPLTVSPGGTLSLPLRFTPGAVGARQAQATFTFEGTARASAAVELQGEGTSPLVAVTPDRLDFGTRRMGEAFASLSLQLRNTGTGPLTLNRVALSGADAARFSLASVTQPFTLAPGASRELTVTLEPDAVRTFSATLVVESDDASHPRVEVPLSGKVVSGYLAVEPTSWDFGRVSVGADSPPRTFTVTNASSSPRTVDSVQSTSAAFKVEAGELQAATLAPGASASFRVLFQPETAGPASGEIRLTLRGESTPDAVLAVTGAGREIVPLPAGCSCSGGGSTSAAAALGLLALLALSVRRTRRS
jgi:MYXO-CTERM domain-containing protein